MDAMRAAAGAGYIKPDTILVLDTGQCRLPYPKGVERFIGVQRVRFFNNVDGADGDAAGTLGPHCVQSFADIQIWFEISALHPRNDNRAVITR